MSRSRFAFACAVIAAIATSAATPAGAQDTTSDSYINIGTYSVGFPVGDLHHFISPVSWFGTTWEGQWRYNDHFAKALNVGLHDFTDFSRGTTTFPAGAVTGPQVRELLVGTLMASGQ